MACLRRRNMTSWNGTQLAGGRVEGDHLPLRDRLPRAEPGAQDVDDVGELGADALLPAGEQLQHAVSGAMGLHPDAVVLVLEGDESWQRLAPALWEPIQATTGTLFEVKISTYELYLPNDETLGRISAPVRLVVSEDGRLIFAEIAGRLAKRLGVDVSTFPGAHATYHEHPSDLAEGIRPFLREVSANRRGTIDGLVDPQW